jgi:hypothetical protein
VLLRALTPTASHVPTMSCPLKIYRSRQLEGKPQSNCEFAATTIRCIRHVTVVKKFVATSLKPIEECSKCVTQAVWHINVKCVGVTSSQLLTPWRISQDRFLAY